jgi:hypothetical protein
MKAEKSKSDSIDSPLQTGDPNIRLKYENGDVSSLSIDHEEMQ